MPAAALFAWSGGAVFVFSLAYCTWWYLFRLGLDGPFAGAGAVLWNSGLVTIFACHHSVFARERVKSLLRPRLGDLLRSVYVWVASLLLCVVCSGWRRVGATLVNVTGAAALACVIVQVAGVGLIAWSVSRIDPLELAGIRRASSPAALQIGGPYRMVRHPLYLGWMLATFVTPHLTGDRLLFAVSTSLYLVVAIPWEERLLQRTFGPPYGCYTAHVRWRVIPFIY